MPIGGASAGIASLKSRWPPGQVITVCFFGGTQQVRSQVANVASEWLQDLNVRFDFGSSALLKSPSSLNSCSEGGPYDVRITFGEQSWSYVGTDSRMAEPGKPTMMLPASGDIRINILHEFGHVLGLLHYEQDPKLKCLDDINFDYMRSIGFTPDGVRGYIQPIAPDNGEFVSTPSGSTTVMRVFTNPQFYKRGENSPCHGPMADAPSADDLKLARLLYPLKPSEVSSTEPRHVLIRFEGLLAAEHFGYVTAALYDIGRITLKKHVSTTDETIADVIANERLAPKRTTSDSLDRFLCRINSHACRTSDGSPTWTNGTAEKNYVDQGLECGSKQLPKFVLCIPNIRLESYVVITSVPNPADDKTLRDLVVGKYRGCDELDGPCRKLIAGLNPERNPAYTQMPDQKLRVPAKAYRLVVEYSNEAERNEIERALNAVIQTRAKDLKLKPEQVSIRISYPVSNPTSQAAGRVFAEPAAGYVDVLKAMSYPFGETTTETELFGFPKVSVAIWDNHVDDGNCELSGHVFSTPSGRPAGEAPVEVTPPSPTANCGTERPSGYILNTGFDHATAVAGILSAKVNGKGIAGIVPEMKIWAWEVVNGNQFNAGNNPEVIKSQQYPDLNLAVVNISQTYAALGNEQGSPALKSILFGDGEESQGLHNIMLFVAAAGASKPPQGGSEERNGSVINLDSECFFYPACLSNRPGGAPRALISVVALNRTGDDVLKSATSGEPLSNYGTAFDVAAIGSVTAPFHGGWLGTFQGSSAATPYVTGLAALLTQRTQSKGVFAKKIEIKNRILFSADDTPSNKGLSRFGRVNFRKALNFENDYLRFASSALCPEDPCARQVRVDRNTPTMLNVTNGISETGQPIGSQSIDFKKLKSLRRADDDSFTVIYVDTGGALAKITNSQIAPSDNRKIVKYRKPDGSLFADTFRINDLQEYVSCSWYPYCGKSD
ncbi:MAG: S8 family serine peptidase [bacterium]|nr:S8 family serine peptidase [bacterium]